MRGLFATPLSSFVAKPPDLSHTDLGQNIPTDPTERVDRAGSLLDNLGRSLRTVRHSADELANAGAILAEKGDQMADVASYIKEARAHSGKMQANIADILRLIKDMKSASEDAMPLPACLLAASMPPTMRHRQAYSQANSARNSQGCSMPTRASFEDILAFL